MLNDARYALRAPGDSSGFTIAAVLTLAVGGLLLLIPLARACSSYLFGIAPDDPISLGAASGIVLVAAAVATWISAPHAATIDPLDAVKAP